MSGVVLENEDATENPEPEADLHSNNEFPMTSNTEDEYHISNNALSLQDNLVLENVHVGLNGATNTIDSENLCISNTAENNHTETHDSNEIGIHGVEAPKGSLQTDTPRDLGADVLDFDQGGVSEDDALELDQGGILVDDALESDQGGVLVNDALESDQGGVVVDDALESDQGGVSGHDAPEADLCDETSPVYPCENVTLSETDSPCSSEQVLKLTKSESVESYEPECDQESTLQNNARSDMSANASSVGDNSQISTLNTFHSMTQSSVLVTSECKSDVDAASEQRTIHTDFDETECNVPDLEASSSQVSNQCLSDKVLREGTNQETSVMCDDDLLSELDSELGVNNPSVENGSVLESANVQNGNDPDSPDQDNENVTKSSCPEVGKCAVNSSLEEENLPDGAGVVNSFRDDALRKEDFSDKACEVIEDLQKKLSLARQQLDRQERNLHKSNEDYKDLQMKFEELVSQKEKELNTDDLYLPQIKELEYTISQQQQEINSLRDKLSSHDAAAKRAVTALQTEIKQRTDQMTKLYKEAISEKDQMVVKYAQAEKNNLGALKNIERLESKIKDNSKEKESLLGKIKDLKLEKTRLGHELDLKSNEALSLKKEAEKIREQVSSADVRIKWAQNKLKAELDSHKETKANLEKTNQRLKEAKEETEQIRRNCQEIIKTYQESEEIKSNNLDQQLKKKETELLLHETESKDKEELYTTAMKELEQLKIKHRETLAELQTYQDKTQCLEEEHRKDEETMNKFKHMLQKQKTENKDLQDKVEQMVQLQMDFKNAQKTIKSLDSEISALKITNKDLSIEMEGCRKREAEKLELTEKLSAKNAELQSENSVLNDRVMALSVEEQSLKMDLQSKETIIDELSRKLSAESSRSQQEISHLSEKLKEKSNKVEELSTKIDDEKDEIKTLKRKHVNSMKDLTRQLQQARRKLEVYETNGEKESLGSRTSSTGSLNTITNGDSHPVTQVPQLAYRQPSPPEQEYPVITEQVEPDKQMLIERIVKLQRMLARRNEKIEFIEDHTHQLVDELQKKNKIIQMYTLREETGTLTAEAADHSKAQLARKHSIMGSVYSSHQTDGTMTLDLSLEINRKLQAVLEDTLLKNMTLKDSLDTLGEEISRLSQENRQMQIQLERQRR